MTDHFSVFKSARTIAFTYLVLIITAAILFGCVGNSEFRQRLTAIDSLLIEHPDSVFGVLNDMEALAQEQSRSDRMYYELLRADAQNKAYVDFTTDSIMKEVVEWYDSHGTPNEQMRAYYLLGCTYRDIHEAPMALQCYQEAIDKADTTNASCDFYTMASVYGQMANLYHSQLLPKEAGQAYMQYSRLSAKVGERRCEIQGLELQVKSMLLLGDTAGILRTIDNVCNLYKQNGMCQEAARVYPVVMYIYQNRGQYEVVDSLMRIYETESGLFDEFGHIAKNKEKYYHIKGLSALHKRDLRGARKYFYEAITKTNDTRSMKDLASLYNQIGKNDSAMKYMEMYIGEMGDQIYALQTQTVQHMNSLYDYSRNQRIAATKEREANLYSSIAYISTMLIVIVLATSYFFYSRKDRKRRRELANLNHSYLLAVNRYENVKNELKCESDALTEKEEELSSLRSEIETMRNRYEQLNSSSRKIAIKESPVYCKFADQLKRNAQPIRKSDWKDLETLMLQCLPTFYHNVIGRDCLSNDEKQLTILTRLEFTPGEISVIMDKSTQRITNLRSSANQKLFGDNSARMLKEHLMTL